MTDWSDWIGRTEKAQDCLTSSAVRRLNATLDTPVVNAPFAHWLCFLPSAPQSTLDADGHPQRGGMLPPIPLPRRMWAGGRLRFHAPLCENVPLSRHSEIVDVREKMGASGPLAFVTVRHQISSEETLLLTEEQDIVYRAASGAQNLAASTPGVRPTTRPDASRLVTPEPSFLFRFSALTFNAHRIHFDRDYAQHVEGYQGLVVHGPLLAMLLADLWQRETPRRTIKSFSFRAQRPMLDQSPFQLCMSRTDRGASLWTVDVEGYVTMTAEIESL